MTGRKRRFSTVSADEAEERLEKVKYMSEKAALKQVPAGTDPDDWPCFLLEDATIYLRDGKTVENLLHADLRGPFVVRGRLVVDKEDRKSLLNKKAQDQHIELNSCTGFSIGCGPITIWAAGRSGWFEIRPSLAYHVTYGKMVDGVSIFYFLTDLFEGVKRLAKKNFRKAFPIDQILMKYGMADGTGLVRSEISERMRSQAEFLMSQMMKDSTIPWTQTTIFKWLIAECPNEYSQLVKKNGQMIKPVEPVVKVDPIERKASAKEVHESTQNSRQLENHPESIVGIILQILADAHGSDRCERRTMTYSKLCTILYRDYSIKTFALAKEVVRVRAKSILASLDADWTNTGIYEQLKEVVAEPKSPTSDIKTEALDIDLHRRQKVGRKISNSRKSSHIDLTDENGSSSSHARREGRHGKIPDNSNFSTPSPVPKAHASKFLLPPHSARRSGKVAGLRLSTSAGNREDGPADERNTLDSESEEDVTTRPRKRNRHSTTSLNAAAPTKNAPIDITSSSSSSPNSTPSSPTSSPRETTLTLIPTTLPLLSPTGPNGLWTCPKASCSFLVRDATTVAGRQAMQSHFLTHADVISQENLILKESVATRLPVEHLLEKLRQIGEGARLEAEDKQYGGLQNSAAPGFINGKKLPLPIKRSWDA